MEEEGWGGVEEVGGGGGGGGGGMQGIGSCVSFFAVPLVLAFPVRLLFLAGTVRAVRSAVRASVPDLPVNLKPFNQGSS